jgi:FMN-dependent oxidoreductase (nitrilotriacetate monooxygenase family)
VTHREIRLNAFYMNTIGHSWPGFWRHPRDQSLRYTDLDYWIELARTLERGLFDALFLADVVGIYDVYGQSPATALRSGAQVPINDPAVLISAMAAATRNLGFGVTANLVQEPPFLFTRRFSTLDHLTKGRIGWNIVTGYLDSGARGKGLKELHEHDNRYEIAEEYMELVYRLWEESWEDDAVVRDREAGVITRPERIHRIRHHGTYFDLDAIHMSEPSPQRTPLLFQAGASTKGRAFAARHAESIFVSGSAKPQVRRVVSDIRRQAVAFGRRPRDIVVFLGATVIVAPTAAEARDKREEYERYVDTEGSLALISGWSGLDLAQYPPEAPIAYVRSNATQSTVEALTSESPERPWTVRDLGGLWSTPPRGPVIVGSPVQVADELQSWLEEGDVDGFNLIRHVTPEYLTDFIELVVPELQNRGAFKRAYADGTLREKLLGRGARLGAEHPAARHRRGAATQEGPRLAGGVAE